MAYNWGGGISHDQMGIGQLHFNYDPLAHSASRRQNNYHPSSGTGRVSGPPDHNTRRGRKEIDKMLRRNATYIERYPESIIPESRLNPGDYVPRLNYDHPDNQRWQFPGGNNTRPQALGPARPAVGPAERSGGRSRARSAPSNSGTANSRTRAWFSGMRVSTSQLSSRLRVHLGRMFGRLGSARNSSDRGGNHRRDFEAKGAKGMKGTKGANGAKGMPTKNRTRATNSRRRAKMKAKSKTRSQAIGCEFPRVADQWRNRRFIESPASEEIPAHYDVLASGALSIQNGEDLASRDHEFAASAWPIESTPEETLLPDRGVSAGASPVESLAEETLYQDDGVTFTALPVGSTPEAAPKVTPEATPEVITDQVEALPIEEFLVRDVEDLPITTLVFHDEHGRSRTLSVRDV